LLYDAFVDAPMEIELEVSLDPTLGCGQAHRWIRKGNVWEGVLGKSIVTLEQTAGGFVCSGAGRNEMLEYFRSDDDLDLIYRDISKDPIVARLVDEYHGLRILRQDPWECTATYILATNANVKRIASMVDNVCRAFGKDLGGRYSFPDPKDILDGRERIGECRLGYRDQRLVDLASSAETGELDLDGLKDRGYEECVSSLKSVNGIGDKVADCIALFSYGHLNAMPIDARIHRHLNDLYGITGSYARMSDAARKHFGPYAGYAQEFLYHSGI